MRCRRCRLACKLYGASAEQARRRNHIRDPLATRRPPRVRCQQRSRRPPRTDVCLGREEEAKDKENGKCHDDGDGTPGRSDRMVMDLGACAVPVPEEVASRSQLAGFRRGGQAARLASFHAEEYHRTASTSAHMCAVCVRRRLAAAAARKNNSAVRAISACGTTTHSRIVESIPPAWVRELVEFLHPSLSAFLGEHQSLMWPGARLFPALFAHAVSRSALKGTAEPVASSSASRATPSG